MTDSDFSSAPHRPGSPQRWNILASRRKAFGAPIAIPEWCFAVAQRKIQRRYYHHDYDEQKRKTNNHLFSRPNCTYALGMAVTHENPVMDWKSCPLVEINPRKLSGVPVLKGTRMQADSIVDNYTDGLTPDEIAEVFELPVDSVRALVAFAVRQNPSLRP